jgi:hypothetical protein
MLHAILTCDNVDSKISHAITNSHILQNILLQNVLFSNELNK